MLNDAEGKSIAKAREYLIKHGICARDGSGESNVEVLFLQIHRLDKQNKALLDACKVAVEALYNVPEVGNEYDQQHSDTHMRATLKLKDVRTYGCNRQDREEVNNE